MGILLIVSFVLAFGFTQGTIGCQIPRLQGMLIHDWTKNSSPDV